MTGVAVGHTAIASRRSWRRRILEPLFFAVAAIVLCNLPLVSSRSMEAVTQTNLGFALQQEGHWAQAEARYREAIRLAPKNPQPHNKLGVLLVSTGRVCEGIAEFRTALQLQPGFTEASHNLDRALALTRGEVPRTDAKPRFG